MKTRSVISTMVRERHWPLRGMSGAAAARFVLRLVIAAVLSCAPFASTVETAGQGPPDDQLPGAPPLPESLARDLDLDRLRRLKAAAEESTDLDETTRAQTVDQLQQAIESLTDSQRVAAETAALRAEIEAAPALFAQIEADLRQPRPAIDIPTDASIAELEQGLAQVEADAQAARENAAELTRDAEARSARAVQLPADIARARQELQLVDDELRAIGALDLNDPAIRARALAAAARRRVLEQTIVHLETERQWIEARRQTLEARRERARVRIAIADERIDAWRPVVARALEREASLAAAEAEGALLEVMGDNEEIRLIAERLVRLAEIKETYTRKLTAANDRLAEDTRLHTSIRSEFAETYEQVRLAGLTDTMGLILRARRALLPNARYFETEIDQREEEASAALSLQFELEDSDAADPDAIMNRLSVAAADLGPEDQATIREIAEKTVTAHADALRLLRRYTQTLGELDAVELKIIGLVESFTDFVDERILWIRSHAPIGLTALRDAGDGFVALADPSHWLALVHSAAIELDRRPETVAVPALAALAWLVFIIVLRPRLHAEHERIARSIETSRLTPSIVPTLRELVVVSAEAWLWPSLLLVLAIIIRWPRTAPAEADAIADALIYAACAFAGLEFIRRSCRERGLALVHFRWPRGAVVALRNRVAKFSLALIPLILLAETVSVDSGSLANDNTARILFIFIMIVAALFAHQILRPSGPVMSEYLAANPGGWIARFRLAWYWLSVGAPLILAVLAAIGYYYSANRLDDQLRISIVLALGLILGSAVFYRWLWVARRRVAIDQARRRRAAMIKEQEEERESAGAAVGSASEINVVEEAEIDLPAANLQALGLFRSAAALVVVLGMWFIWIDVLPALEILNRFELYPDFGPIAATDPELPAALREDVGAGAPLDAAGPNGSASANENQEANGAAARPTIVQSSSPVTVVNTADTATGETTADISEEDRVMLGEVALAILLVIITVAATKNLPGMLEIVLLQRLPLDSGARYAVTTIARYLIIIIGVGLAFSAVGVGWSKVQWLVAALTFGLAFGLQEIFANFISGIIILVERPMRVGDTITIGDISGEVARIRMRATTITQWNRKELIVPNKEFITGKLVNWTLSDPTLRLEIPIGVAYGSDVRAARDLLLSIASRQEQVLDDPPPRAVLLGFGDSSINLELRVFIPHLSHLVDVRDALLFAIDEEFKKAQIEIPFPQRDIHVRSIESALDLRDIREKKDDGRGDAGTVVAR